MHCTSTQSNPYPPLVERPKVGALGQAKLKEGPCKRTSRYASMPLAFLASLFYRSRADVYSRTAASHTRSALLRCCILPQVPLTSANY